MIRLAGALLFAACAQLAIAQAPAPAPEGKDKARAEQTQAKDPAKCNERAGKMRQAHKTAIENCKTAQPDKHRDCMRHEMCAHADYPVKCEDQARRRDERRKAKPKPSS